MAHTYTEGYRRGFEVMGRDLSKKKTVVVEYQLGFERMIRRAVEQFRSLGLEPVCYRAAVESLNRRSNGKGDITVRLPTASMIMTTAMTAPCIWEMLLRSASCLF